MKPNNQSIPIESFTGPHHFLSNFYLSPIMYENVTYRSLEHAFQAAKTLNPIERQLLATMVNPGKAKKRGQTVTLRPGWDRMKLDVMLQLLRTKFLTNDDLKIKLVETGDRPLIEGNNWGDTFWGVSNGQGTNHLGRLLMLVREEAAKSLKAEHGVW